MAEHGVKIMTLIGIGVGTIALLVAIAALVTAIVLHHQSNDDNGNGNGNGPGGGDGTYDRLTVGTLNVTGNSAFRGSIDASNQHMDIHNLAVDGTLHASDRIQLTGEVDGDMTVSGEVTTHDLQVDNDTHIDHNLYVGNHAHIDNLNKNTNHENIEVYDNMRGSSQQWAIHHDSGSMYANHYHHL